MKPDASVSAPAAADPVQIAPAVEGDLPGIVEIFNYTAANSIANFYARPVSVAERRGWFGQFSGSSALPKWARFASTPPRTVSTSARYGCSALCRG
jgi:hypothetical protein